MINFIINDSSEWSNTIKNIIDKHMMNYDIEVKYHLLKKIKGKIETIKGFKVYIINCDPKNGEGFKNSEYIRNDLDDWNSIIILLTNHNEMKYEVIGKRLFLFDFICKKNHFEEILREDIERITKNYNNREKCLIFQSNRILRKIDYKNIDMIIKEKESKKCLLKASHGSYYIPESLNKIETRLDDRFVKINRSCIINSDEIIEYDLNENKITLKNGDVSFDISRDCKKNLNSYFNRYK